MQLFKALRTFSLILVFALVTFGCATSKNQVVNADFGLTAEAVSEGLLITFSNIPTDAIRMTVHVSYWDTDEQDRPYGFVSSFADLRDASFLVGSVSSVQLEQVKQNGRVIFPVVQEDKKYTVSAYVFTKRDHELFVNDDENYHPVWATAEFTAKNGIYFNRGDAMLELNDDKSAVTLSSEPVFSSDVNYYTKKYSFGVTILVDDKGSIGVGDHHIPDGLSSDGLTWVFEPQMKENIRESDIDWLESGANYLAWASAYANIIYNDILWSVEVSHTPTFDFSL